MMAPWKGGEGGDSSLISYRIRCWCMIPLNHAESTGVFFS